MRSKIEKLGEVCAGDGQLAKRCPTQESLGNRPSPNPVHGQVAYPGGALRLASQGWARPHHDAKEQESYTTR